MEPQGQVTVLDYWRVVWRARSWILAMTVLAAVVAIGIARSQPKIYTARVTILPPRESGPQSFSVPLGALGAMFLGGSGGGREGVGQAVPGISISVPSLSPNQDIFLALLNSRTMRQEVLAEAAKNLGPSVGSMVVSAQADTRDKIIGVTVVATAPKLAADVANSYVAHLDRMLERYADQSARRQEQLYKGQLERAAKEVEAAEEALLKFQAEKRAIAVDAPTRGAVDAVAYLRGQIMALEMQREIQKMRFTDQHPQMRELEKQIAELKRQYSKTLFGEAMDLPPESPSAKVGRKEFFVPAEKMTPVQFSFLKLYRNLKIQEAFYTAALQGLQQIKYTDGFTFPSVEVLDPALPPSGPSGGGIWRKLAAAVGSALIAGIFLAFIMEYLHRVRAHERQVRSQGSAQSRRSDDGSGLAKIPDTERVGTFEGEGTPVSRARGSLTGGE